MAKSIVFILLILTASIAQKSDTFPDEFIGNWKVIGFSVMGSWYVDTSNYRIIITKDSMVVIKDSIFLFDSCSIRTSYGTTIINAGYDYYLSNETLVQLPPGILGAPSYSFIRSQNKVYMNIKITPTKLSKQRDARIFNVKGQIVINKIDNNRNNITINQRHKHLSIR